MQILAPNPNTPAPEMQNVLLVMMPTYFHPGWERGITGQRVGQFDFYKLKFWQKVLVSKSFVHNTRSNPRSIPYMANLALAFLEANAPNASVDLLADVNASADLPTEFSDRVRNLWFVEQEAFNPWQKELGEKLHAAQYDTILLLYADANGLGWTRIEARMKALDPSRILVINGRKRVFYLDGVAQNKLRWRRVLEWLWITEFLFGIVAVLLAIPLALYDLTLGKLIRSFNLIKDE